MYEGNNANIIIMNTHTSNGKVVLCQDPASDSDTGEHYNMDSWALFFVKLFTLVL